MHLAGSQRLQVPGFSGFPDSGLGFRGMEIPYYPSSFENNVYHKHVTKTTHEK